MIAIQERVDLLLRRAELQGDVGCLQAAVPAQDLEDPIRKGHNTSPASRSSEKPDDGSRYEQVLRSRHSPSVRPDPLASYRPHPSTVAAAQTGLLAIVK